MVIPAAGIDSNDKNPVVKVTGDQPFTLVNSTVEGTGRNPILVKTSGKVVISGNTFGCEEQNIYNMIEFSISNDADVTSVTIEGNTFKGPFKNNCVSLYNLAEGAEVNIKGNQFTDIDVNNNPIRISNPKNVNATFNIADNTYKYNGRSATEWTGFILLQDYAKAGEKQDFSKFTINISNLYRGSKKLTSNGEGLDRVFYVYDDQDGILASGVNDPIVHF